MSVTSGEIVGDASPNKNSTFATRGFVVITLPFLCSTFILSVIGIFAVVMFSGFSCDLSGLIFALVQT